VGEATEELFRKRVRKGGGSLGKVTEGRGGGKEGNNKEEGDRAIEEERKREDKEGGRREEEDEVEEEERVRFDKLDGSCTEGGEGERRQEGAEKMGSGEGKGKLGSSEADNDGGAGGGCGDWDDDVIHVEGEAGCAPLAYAVGTGSILPFSFFTLCEDVMGCDCCCVCCCCCCFCCCFCCGWCSHERMEKVHEIMGGKIEMEKRKS
jgi:hypothetical protein